MKKLQHQKVDWESNSERIILYADIMGFKQFLKKNTHSVVVENLRLFVDNIQKNISPFRSNGHLRMTLFSDLVVMAVDSCTPKNFLLIVKAAAELMRECYKHNFPINGCISCGNLVFDDLPEPAKPNQPYMPLFAGQSVVDAYLLNEDLFCYGIVLHPNAERLFRETQKAIEETGEEIPPFSMLEIPLKKGGFAPLYYLDWTEVKLANNDIDIKGVISQTQSISTDQAVRTRAYALNTLNLLKKFNED